MQRASKLPSLALAERLPGMVWASIGNQPLPGAAWLTFTRGEGVEPTFESWLNAVHSDDLAQAAASWQQVLDHGTPFDEELRLRRHDGVYRWCQCAARPIAEGWLIHFRDVHELREVRRQCAQLQGELARVEASREQLVAILDGSEAAIVSKDERGIITSWNRGAERLFGYTDGEALGQPVRMLVPTRMADEEGWIASSLERGETIDHLETFRLRKDGSEVFVALSVSPLFDREGGRIGSIRVAHDISELRRVRMIAERTNRDLEARVASRTQQLRSANAELEHTADQLRSAQRVAMFGSFELDVASGEMVWSDELFRIFGIDPELGAPRYLPGQPSPYFVEASQQRLDDAIVRCLRDATGFEIALEGRRPDGTLRFWIARGEPVIDAQGRRIVGTVQDVTDREQVARQLSRLTERLQLATSAARLGVWDWSVSHDVLVWDEAMRVLYELPRDRTVSVESWREAIHEEDRPAFEHALSEALRNGTELNHTFRIELGERVKHVRALATVYRDQRGRALRMVGVQVDITEQRSAELALRQSETLQRTMLAHAGVSIIASDCDGTIKLFNRGAEELLGYSAAEVVGRKTPAALHDPDELNVRRAALVFELGVRIESAFDVIVAKARSGGVDVNEWTYIRRDGTRVPVLLTVTAIRDDAGAISGYLDVAVDLTQRKRHERELLQLNRLLGERSLQAESANRAKSEFIANISHDLRTPLAAVSGMSYLLGRTSLSEDQRALLSTLERSTRNLALMVNDVLDLSKIEANQLALEQQPFTVAAVLEELRGLMAGFALGKSLELIIEPQISLSRSLLGDSVRLLQVLTNFAGNAIKFTEQGHVLVRVCELEKPEPRCWLRFEVEDTGPGIEPGALPRLFTRFQRLDDTISKRVSGTGLGLAIVKELCTLMGGRVGVVSEPARGSSFWCELPFPIITSSQPNNEPDFTGRLLVFDAHAGQRAAIAASARCLGWAVEVVGSVAEAGALLQKRIDEGRPIDCVVLDDKLPLAELSELFGDKRRSRASVVLLSAQGGDRHMLLAPLADVVLGKPVTPNALRSAIARALTSRWSAFPPGGGRPRSTAPHGERLPTVRALVVDDSDVNREIARRILLIEGATVETAADGPRALERMETESFDVILMDVQLPGMDGIEVVRRYRERDTSVPIVALTAGALASDRERALDAGMDAFISKPFEPEALIATVRQLIEQARGAPLPLRESTPPDAKPNAWPVIEGIDSAESEQRLRGDRELFRALLGRVLMELESFLAAAPRDPERIARELHRLKGMSGNVGARTLAERLTAAEQDTREIDKLPRLVRRLRESARAFLDGAPADPFHAELEGEVETRLDALVELLRTQDLDAIPLAAELAQPLRERLGVEGQRRLREAIEGLDFPRASELLAGYNRGS